ncbi:MAG: response regulator, partial [Cellvibrio sp.]
VYNPHDALANIEGFRPDVMLIDIGLPEMDGYELVERLSQSAFGRRARKIAVTGYGQAEDRNRALNAGFDEHLVKPVGVQAIERAITRFN